MRQILTRKLALVRAVEVPMDADPQGSLHVSPCDARRNVWRRLIRLAGRLDRLLPSSGLHWPRGFACAQRPISFAESNRFGLSRCPGKNISLSENRKSCICCRRPASMRGGGSRSSRNARRDAMDAKVLTDEQRFSRTAKPCGPGAPTQVSSWRQCLRIAPTTVTKKPGLTGEITE